MRLHIPLTYGNVINNINLKVTGGIFYTITISCSCKFIVIVFLEWRFFIASLSITSKLQLFFLPSSGKKCQHSTRQSFHQSEMKLRFLSLLKMVIRSLPDRTNINPSCVKNHDQSWCMKRSYRRKKKKSVWYVAWEQALTQLKGAWRMSKHRKTSHLCAWILRYNM